MAISEITLEVAIKDFLAWRRSADYSPSTVNNDRTSLNFLVRATSPTKLVRNVDSRHAAAAIELASRVRGPSATNSVQTALGVFFRWARAHHHMRSDSDPLLGFRLRKVPVIEMDRLGVHEFPAFLNAAECSRDRIFCALGLYLFLRASEAVTLRIKDVSLQSGTIAVTVHKTKDFDIMPISEELDQELRGWLTDYQTEMGPLNPDWLLVPAMKQGARFDLWGLSPESRISKPEAIVKRTLERYGVNDSYRAGMHLLRRSGARAYFDELDAQSIDGALRMTQAMLHHKSVTMTERYLGITIDRVKRDRLIKGNAMFPSLSAKEVLSMEEFQRSKMAGW